jgi:hypothetical protein
MKLYEIPAEFAFIEHSLDVLLTATEGEVTPEVEKPQKQKWPNF